MMDQLQVITGLGAAMGAAMREVQSIKADVPTAITGEFDFSVGRDSLLTGKFRVIVETRPKVEVEGVEGKDKKKE